MHQPLQVESPGVLLCRVPAPLKLEDGRRGEVQLQDHDVLSLQQDRAKRKPTWGVTTWQNTVPAPASLHCQEKLTAMPGSRALLWLPQPQGKLQTGAQAPCSAQGLLVFPGGKAERPRPFKWQEVPESVSQQLKDRLRAQPLILPSGRIKVGA